MSGFTDIHAHFLYGMDDGAKTQKEMEDMLTAANADGISSLFATPHATPGLEPFDTDLLRRRLDEARAFCWRMGYAMQLFPGAEILCTPAIEPAAMNHRLPTLADSTFLLVEFVPDVSFSEMQSMVDLLERSGYTTILAHIERYGCLEHGNARKLKEKYDIRYQLNCASILSGRGFWKDRCIRRWLKEELIDFVATDTHGAHWRPSRMRETYKVLEKQYGVDYAMRLTGCGE